MALLPPALRIALHANAVAGNAARYHGRIFDPAPIAKFFYPRGLATWLATELAADGDTLFGLADLGFGCPASGTFSLGALEALRLPSGPLIARDVAFATRLFLSIWIDAARAAGSILWVEQMLRPPAASAAARRAAITFLQASKEQ
ncbi:MAG TPA: DUF2958 domain-containing protein [Sphingomonas sp.]|nr:DUF2958 domain-containing protein [Sphingomonas sp.]